MRDDVADSRAQFNVDFVSICAPVCSTLITRSYEQRRRLTVEIERNSDRQLPLRNDVSFIIRTRCRCAVDERIYEIFGKFTPLDISIGVFSSQLAANIDSAQFW